MGRLSNKVALITGAGDGIGAATAQLFACEGATVVVTDIRKDRAERVVGQIGTAAISFEHDARDADSWRRIVDATVEGFGRLDILVNNAGTGSGKNIEDQTLDEFRYVMAVNVEGTFTGCKQAIRVMKGNGGAIVNVSSVHGIRAAAHEAAYSASKGAVRLLTKSIALHCARGGYAIRCNSIHPGYIVTRTLERWINAAADPQMRMNELVNAHPIGFLGQPNDIAHGIVYLASDEARFVTGAELVVDGGYML